MPRKPPIQRYREKSHAQALYENEDLRERVAELEMALRAIAAEMVGAHDGGHIFAVQEILRRVAMKPATRRPS